MNVFVRGDPIPQGSKRALLSRSTNRPIVVDANRIGLADWRADITATVMQHRQHNGDSDLMTGPVRVTLSFYLKRPANHYLPVNSKRTKPELRLDAPRLHTTAPDLDKLTRAVLDALTDAAVWGDDAQVVSCLAAKLYPAPSQPVGVDIWVMPM